MKRSDELESVKTRLLPKTIDLHGMTTTEVAWESEPNFIEVNGVNRMVSDRRRWDITLSDGKEMTVKITIHEPIKYHQIDED